MIRAVFNEKEDFLKIYGLTQWDYGQELQIIGLQNLKRPEVHFAAGNSASALICPASMQTDGSILTRIPDKLLEKGENIKAYVYVADETSGETVYTMTLYVTRRPKPEEYNSPAEKSLLRQMIEKLDTKADSLKLVDGELVLKAGEKELEPRVRLPTAGGREIELRNNGTAIQWRYTDSNDWTDLITLEELIGDTLNFTVSEDGHLIATIGK